LPLHRECAAKARSQVEKYIKHYVGAHADFTELELDDDDPRHAMIKRHNPRKLRPVLVFLDGQGKEVARLTAGLKSAEEALAARSLRLGKALPEGRTSPSFKEGAEGLTVAAAAASASRCRPVARP
jgi:hypothetical protein